MQGHVWGAILYTTSCHVVNLRCALLEDANLPYCHAKSRPAKY